MAYKDGWMWKRFESLQDTFDSGELKSVLRVTHQTISNWRESALFHEAKVATQLANGRWEWNKDRLRLWLCAIGAIKQKKISPTRGKRKIAKNPPSLIAKGKYPSREEAVEMLQEFRDGN